MLGLGSAEKLSAPGSVCRNGCQAGLTVLSLTQPGQANLYN